MKLMREALIARCKAEREALAAVAHLYPKAVGGRLEEKLARFILKEVPSIFFFAEQIAKKRGSHYMRPLWAEKTYGAR